MKSNYKIAAAVIASFVLGVAAVNVLHAQAKLPAYVVAEIDVKDQDGYTKDFLPKAQANIKKAAANTSPAALTKPSACLDRPHQIAWRSYNLPIWTRSRHSMSNRSRLRQRLATNTPASA